MPRFLFNKEINAGEVLTFISIVGSVFSLLWSWNSDRELRIHENADKIRIEAANVLGKIKRTKDIHMSFYDEIQSDIVEVSEMMKQTQNQISARDLMWKKLQLKRGEMQRRILDEQVETAYVGLLPFDNRIDSLYNMTMLRLKNLHSNQFRMLLIETEAAVIDFKTGKEGETAVLGNALRGIVARYRTDHENLIGTATTSLVSHLNELISSPDRLLLDY